MAEVSRQLAHYTANKEEINKDRRNKRKRWKEEGKCRTCGKDLDKNSVMYCEYHHQKALRDAETKRKIIEAGKKALAQGE